MTAIIHFEFITSMYYLLADFGMTERDGLGIVDFKGMVIEEG